MKKLTKTVLAVIVLAIIAVVIYVVFFDKAQAPQSLNTNGDIPVEHWQMYSDPVSSISLEAPEGLATSTLADTFSIVFPTTTPYVHTHLLHELRIDIPKPVTKCDDLASGPTSTTTSQVINGVIFERQNWSDVGAGNLYQGIDYLTTHNNLCYRVTLFTHSTNGEEFYTGDTVQIAKVDAQQAIDIKNLFALFDQVVSTIRFTK